MNPRLPNGQFLRIDELYAFVAIDKEGHEGILGMTTAGGWVPLIGADLARIESIKPYADATGIKYEIRYFQRVAKP